MTANTPKTRKAKARIVQNETKDLIYAFNPELLPGDVRGASMGMSGVDILLSPKGKVFIPLSIECKNVETFHIWSTWEQAIEHARNHPGTMPAITFRRAYHELLAVCSARDLFKLMRGYYENNNKA